MREVLEKASVVEKVFEGLRRSQFLTMDIPALRAITLELGEIVKQAAVRKANRWWCGEGEDEGAECEALVSDHGKRWV